MSTRKGTKTGKWAFGIEGTGSESLRQVLSIQNGQKKAYEASMWSGLTVLSVIRELLTKASWFEVLQRILNSIISV